MFLTADTTADAADALLKAMLEFRKLAFRHHSPGELGRTEIAILMVLDREAVGMRISDLARLLESSPPTMTQSTTSLAKLGYVERLPDPADRRVTRIGLTEAGRRMVLERKRHFRGFCERLAAALGREDSLKLSELLAKTAGFLQTDEFHTQKENRL